MNAAGASPQGAACHDAMVRHLQRERTIGAYAAAAAEDLPDAHAALATLLNCDRDEIALAESAQRAWALAFSSLQLQAGDRIFCFEGEYAGNAVTFLQAAQRTGCELEVLPMRADGIADVAALQTALEAAAAVSSSSPAPKQTEEEERDGSAPSGRRTVIALTHINTDSSVVQPAAAVGALARRHDAVYILDACQSIGQMPVDVKALGCDFAAGTGRKWLRGPRGTGFLYAKRDALLRHPLVGEPLQIDHTSVKWTARDRYVPHPDARRYEFWESSIAGRSGLAAAANMCSEVGPARIHAIASALAGRLRAGLSGIDGVTMRDAPPRFDDATAAALGAGRCAHVTFALDANVYGSGGGHGSGIDAKGVHAALLAHKIGASVSPSTHTFDETQWDRPVVVRLSPSYYNTPAEVDKVVEVVREVLASARRA